MHFPAVAAPRRGQFAVITMIAYSLIHLFTYSLILHLVQIFGGRSDEANGLRI